MRYAIYFTPGQDDPLARRAAAWLGRDAFTNEAMPVAEVPGLAAAEIAFHTAAARRYGFHATLKAPFRLAEGETEASLIQAVQQFADRTDVIVIPRLAVASLDGFLALVPEAPFAPLNSLADNVVRSFEHFRAPLSDAEIQRRNPDALSPAEVRNLCQWGYPYVFESFRFHMTLTGRLAASERAQIQPRVEAYFAPVISTPVPVEGLALFIEPEAGAPFSILSYHALSRRPERKFA